MDIFWSFLLQVLVLLAAAMVLGAIFDRLRQSAMVGYLLAGVLVGPHVLNLVISSEDVVDAPRLTVDAIAELGVALLMFSIGLEFSVSKLRAMGAKTLLAGLLQIVGTMAVFGGGAMALGQDFSAAVAIGAIVSLSSTAVVLPMLAARSEVDSVHGRFALGILLLQDVAVIPLVLIVASLGSGSGPGAIMLGTLNGFLLVGLFIVAMYLFSRFVLPYIVKFAGEAGNREMPILFAIVMAAGSAWIANQLGISPALGAFIAGIFLGESVLSTQLRGDIGPLKTVFATLFFASIGLVADLPWVWANLGQVLLTVLAVVLLKPAVVWAVGKAMGLTHRHAIAAGVSMGQIGVFSFVLAKVAYTQHARSDAIITDDTFNLMVSVTIATLFLTPYLVRIALPTGALIQRGLRKVGLGQSSPADAVVSSTPVEDHVVIVGFGPAGREVQQMMHAAGRPTVIIDLNPNTVMEARASGIPAYVGDAGRSDILQHAQVQNAKAVVITLPDPRAATAAIRMARSLSTATVIVRARYARYEDDLRAAGAHAVVNEETHVGALLGFEVGKTV